MGTAIRTVTLIALCCVCNIGSHAEQAGEVSDPDRSKEIGVTIELVKLEVTDFSLGVTYTIRNRSDHDVWVCSKISSVPYEVFLTYDKQTLLIRKRLDVPSDAIWHRPPAPATYERLSPGADQSESLTVDLPATPRFVYAGQQKDVVTQTVRHLALEIGYYDEDLPALLRGIVEVAAKFSPEARYVHPDIQKTYFRGLHVGGALTSPDAIGKDPYREGRVYIDYSYQALTGEKVVRMEISGIAIPYNGPTERQTAPKFPVIIDNIGEVDY